MKTLKEYDKHIEGLMNDYEEIKNECEKELKLGNITERAYDTIKESIKSNLSQELCLVIWSAIKCLSDIEVETIIQKYNISI